jgi:hypothetical protein
MNFLYRLIFIFLAIFSYSFSQPHIEWQKSFGGSFYDWAVSIIQTTNGDFIAVGASESTDGDIIGHRGDPFIRDEWIVKINSEGKIIWQKSLGGSGSDAACSLNQTNDEGYITAGYTFSNDFDVTGNHASGDYWIIKFNSNGDIEWQNCLGGNEDDAASSIQQTNDSGYIIAGFSRSNDGNVTGHHGSHESEDFWIVKVDINGAIQWQKSLGGSETDIPKSIQQTNDGGYIVAGYSESNDGDVTENHGGGDYWVVKLNPIGDIVWQKSLGGSGTDYPYSIQQTNDGGYIIIGASNSNDGDIIGKKYKNTDCWIVKLDSIGTIQWQKLFGGNDDDYFLSMSQTNNGNYIAVGLTFSKDGDVTENRGHEDCWIVKLDSICNIIWQKTIGGSDNDWGNSIIKTNDDGYIIAGVSNSKDGDVTGNHGNWDMWIVKLSPDINDVKDNTKLSNIEISISPNPASDNISISFPEGINQSILIFNSLGIEIKRFEEKDLFEKNSIDVNVEGLPTGIYYVVQDIQSLADFGCLTKSFVLIR